MHKMFCCPLGFFIGILAKKTGGQSRPLETFFLSLLMVLAALESFPFLPFNLNVVFAPALNPFSMLTLATEAGNSFLVAG